MQNANADVNVVRIESAGRSLLLAYKLHNQPHWLLIIAIRVHI